MSGRGEKRAGDDDVGGKKSKKDKKEKKDKKDKKDKVRDPFDFPPSAHQNTFTFCDTVARHKHMPLHSRRHLACD